MIPKHQAREGETAFFPPLGSAPGCADFRVNANFILSIKVEEQPIIMKAKITTASTSALLEEIPTLELPICMIIWEEADTCPLRK